MHGKRRSGDGLGSPYFIVDKIVTSTCTVKVLEYPVVVVVVVGVSLVQTNSILLEKSNNVAINANFLDKYNPPHYLMKPCMSNELLINY